MGVFVFQHLQKMGDNTWGGKVNNYWVRLKEGQHGPKFKTTLTEGRFHR